MRGRHAHSGVLVCVSQPALSSGWRWKGAEFVASANVYGVSIANFKLPTV